MLNIVADAQFQITKMSPICLTEQIRSLNPSVSTIQNISIDTMTTIATKKVSRNPNYTSIHYDCILLSSLSITRNSCSRTKNLGISLCRCCKNTIESPPYIVTMLFISTTVYQCWNYKLFYV